MKLFKRTQRAQQSGFTLVEMLVVAPIVILTIGAFLTVIINMTGEVLASRASTKLTYDVQDALNRVEQDVKLSSSFLATNSVLGTNQGYNDDSTAFVNATGSNGPMLILNMVGTTGNPISTSTSYVYLKNQPNDCSAPQQNTPFTYNIVYFVKNNTLYRRTIMPTNYNDTTNTVCGTPYQQPSCSPSFMDAQASSVFCKTKDVELVKGVTPSTFFIQYFNGESTTSANTAASSASTNTARATALQSATTVSVSIDATQTSAGRDVQRSAVMRVSRLDTNASSIAVVTATTAPNAPSSVTASITEPTFATFQWNKVGTATSYTIEYQINGGAWTTGFSNQNQTTYTVTTSGPSDVVNARVKANNSLGSSGYAYASVTAPLWISPGLQNGWSNFNNGYATASYLKTPDGFVILKGLILDTAFTGSETLFTLPAGYRPEKLQTFQVESNNDGATVTVNPDGTVVASTNIDASWVSLSDVKFLSSTSSHPFTNLTLSNGWTNRASSADDPSLAYAEDAIGRYFVRGTVTGGTSTDNTVIATMPADAVTAKYSHIAVRSGGGGNNLVGVNTTRNLVAKGVGVGSAYFLNIAYLPDSYTGTWNNIAFQNSWANYGGQFNIGQYTKSSDNVVTLRGLIKTGANGTVITTLPVGYRPSARLITAGVCNNTNCRFDIFPNGNVMAQANTSAIWSSLDRISFYADQ
jgi:type II secretory pathway pseudopilin PulG